MPLDISWQGAFFLYKIISHNLNWGIYPVLYQQFTDGICHVPFQQAYLIVGIVFIFVPAIYPIVKARKIITVESQTIKYWAFYASMVYLIFTNSLVFSVIRYAIPLIPIYWVSAKIYTKNRLIGGIMFGVMTGLLIISIYLFEIGSVAMSKHLFVICFASYFFSLSRSK